MSVRSEKVQELDSWTDGCLTSTRQIDGSSCGLFVLLVNYCETFLLSTV